MSDWVFVAGIAGASLVLGAVLAGWFTRERMRVELRVLTERLTGRDARIEELSQEGAQQERKAEQRLALKEQELSLSQLQARDLDTKLAAADMQLREERKAWDAKAALLDEARVKLGDAFKSVSTDVLKSSNQEFLTLAKETLSRFHAENKGDLEQRQQAVHSLVAPIGQSLDKVREQLAEVEKTRAQAYGSLTQHLNQMMAAQDKLRTETGNLVKALRAPQGRGRWGEIQLKRVVEMAGMVEHCDFQQQASRTTEDGRLRPDMVVRLPGGKHIVVDAKAPLSAYLEALEAPTDEVRAQKLVEHAGQVRTHLAKLSAKSYWQQFQPAPEFVVLFLPGESFFSAALQADPSLIEEGVNQQVVVATPTTLIALLKAVSYGWRQENVAENARKISALGNELYERVRTFATHMAKVGGGLNTALDAYNSALGSLETRVLVSARRFKELGAAPGPDLEEYEPLHKSARAPHTSAEQALPSAPPAPPPAPAAIEVATRGFAAPAEEIPAATTEAPGSAATEPAAGSAPAGQPAGEGAAEMTADDAEPSTADQQNSEMARLMADHPATAKLARALADSANSAAPEQAAAQDAASDGAVADPFAHDPLAHDPLGGDPFELDDLLAQPMQDQAASLEAAIAALDAPKPSGG